MTRIHTPEELDARMIRVCPMISVDHIELGLIEGNLVTVTNDGEFEVIDVAGKIHIFQLGEDVKVFA
jgi:hypothetical protein